ncbi:MAG: ABC transporter permease subunit, partial [Myxococcota bacterium]
RGEMIRLLRRVLLSVAVLFALSVVLFALIASLPGNPVDLLVLSNPQVRPEDVARLRRLRGLDQPWPVQYLRWLVGYHEAIRPPGIHPPPDLVVEMAGDGTAEVSLDVGPLLSNPAKPPPATSKRHTSRQITGLFGASVVDTVVSATFTQAGTNALWFIVNDDLGHQVAGRATVFVAPSPEPEASRLGGSPGEQQLAGTWESSAFSDEPTRDSLLQRARAATVPVLHQTPIMPLRLAADDGGWLRVDLREALGLQVTDPVASLRVSLQDGAPGHVASGVFTHRFLHPGQTVIAGTAEVSAVLIPFVLEVSHGPVPDPDHFIRGALFALLADTSALGYSSVYKRPVWELLVGASPVCGDGRRGPGETCDDGGLASGDGCSAACDDERLSLWEVASARAAGWLLTSGRLFNTLQLMLPALLLALVVALPLGVWSASRGPGRWEQVLQAGTFLGISLPVFWVALLGLYVFAERLQWLPAGGVQTPGIEPSLLAVLRDRLAHTALPATVLALSSTGHYLRHVRAAMQEALSSDFVRTARAMGIPERRVLWRHAFPNAVLPSVTLLGVSLPGLFGGALLTETIFSWPGLGRLQYDAIMNNDPYVAMVAFLGAAAAMLAGSFVVDVAYVILDPRTRSGR